jgi:imidazoleglycerol-phosphate dehydratase/histidinol-phosphatase
VRITIGTSSERNKIVVNALKKYQWPKVLFIDRDGTIIKEPEDFQIDSFEELNFYLNFPISALNCQEMDFEFVMVSNRQLGTDSFPENTFYPVQNFIIQTLKK